MYYLIILSTLIGAILGYLVRGVIARIEKQEFLKELYNRIQKLDTEKESNSK